MIGKETHQWTNSLAIFRLGSTFCPCRSDDSSKAAPRFRILDRDHAYTARAVRADLSVCPRPTTADELSSVAVLFPLRAAAAQLGDPRIQYGAQLLHLGIGSLSLLEGGQPIAADLLGQRFDALDRCQEARGLRGVGIGIGVLVRCQWAVREKGSTRTGTAPSGNPGGNDEGLPNRPRSSRSERWKPRSCRGWQRRSGCSTRYWPP